MPDFLFYEHIHNSEYVEIDNEWDVKNEKRHNISTWANILFSVFYSPF